MTHPNPSCRLSGRQLFGVLVVLGVAQLAVLSGCDTGSRSEGGSGGTPGVNPGDVCQTGAAFLLSASTSTGCVGQEIMLEGLNFSPDLGNNRVFFSDNDGEFSIEGLVTQFIDNGPHPIFGCPDTSIVVRVPGGVRSGFISLQVILPDGTKTDAGLVSYAGCPEILGFAVGTAGAPFLAVDAGFAFLNPDFQIYGYNLGTVTGIEIIDPSGAAFPGATVTQGGQATPAYTIAAGLDVVTVTLPTAVVVPTCSAYYLQIRLTDSSAGAPVSSNALIMPVREQFAPAEFEDLPGTIVGCLVPTGVRRGMVPIYYQVVMEPAQSRYDMVPEFLDPLTGTWIECEGPVQQGSRLMTGVSSQQGQYPAIVTGGASYVFEWDTVANGLVYDASDPQATPVTTRVRIRVENPAPAGSTCPTFSQPEARFESASLLIDNPVDFTAVPPVLVGSSGTIAESFNDNLQEDDTAGNTALWNDNESGVLTGLPVSVVPWGEGTKEKEEMIL